MYSESDISKFFSAIKPGTNSRKKTKIDFIVWVLRYMESKTVFLDDDTENHIKLYAFKSDKNLKNRYERLSINEFSNITNVDFDNTCTYTTLKTIMLIHTIASSLPTCKIKVHWYTRTEKKDLPIKKDKARKWNYCRFEKPISQYHYSTYNRNDKNILNWIRLIASNSGRLSVSGISKQGHYIVSINTSKDPLSDTNLNSYYHSKNVNYIYHSKDNFAYIYTTSRAFLDYLAFQFPSCIFDVYCLNEHEYRATKKEDERYLFRDLVNDKIDERSGIIEDVPATKPNSAKPLF